MLSHEDNERKSFIFYIYLHTAATATAAAVVVVIVVVVVVDWMSRWHPWHIRFHFHFMIPLHVQRIHTILTWGIQKSEIFCALPKCFCRKTITIMYHTENQPQRYILFDIISNCYYFFSLSLSSPSLFLVFFGLIRHSSRSFVCTHTKFITIFIDENMNGTIQISSDRSSFFSFDVP